jgi:aryl-alcohol dehydrogenase-like predicted oxidoreductase
MEKRKFGRTDMQFSVLGFGGAELGEHDSQSQEEVDLLLNSALDAGLNVIDTAAAYKSSERKIGEAVSGRRNEYYLLTKCGALDGFSRYDWTKKGTVETIEKSLRNLKTDHLDIVQLHSCDSETLRRGDAIEGLERAREKGYTRYIGYSGDNEAAKTAIELDVFDSLQTSVSVADQSPIDGNIAAAMAAGLGIIAKRPIANAVWRHSDKPDNTYYHDYWDRIQKLQFDFLKGPLEESIGTALRFVLSIPGVATAIVGTTRPNRWQQNAQYARQGNLDDAEFETIRDRWRDVAEPDWDGRT